MSVLIHAITDHKLPEWNNAPRVILQLGAALPDLRLVKEYWSKNLHGQNDIAGKDIDDWQQITGTRSFETTSLRGPGGIYVDIAQRALAISASGRWSGFMTIPELRKVHLAGTIQFEKVEHRMARWVYANKSFSEASTGDEPNGAPAD